MQQPVPRRHQHGGQDAAAELAEQDRPDHGGQDHAGLAQRDVASGAFPIAQMTMP
jgi:hypothetical protein